MSGLINIYKIYKYIVSDKIYNIGPRVKMLDSDKHSSLLCIDDDGKKDFDNTEFPDRQAVVHFLQSGQTSEN